jgi:peptide-methionine (S)-S-oxide reductase
MTTFSVARFTSALPAWRRNGLRLMLGAALLQTAACSFAAEDAVSIAPPQKDERVSSSTTETAVLAGGCFWGVQGVFQHVQGVKKVVSGYAGGKADTAQYERVSEGDTGHAESVEITFDPSQVSYGKLLQIFFSVAHNPTELNRQGPDHGTQYRSAILPKARNSRPSPRPISLSWMPPSRSMRRSSPKSSSTTASTRPRIITRTSSPPTRPTPTS